MTKTAEAIARGLKQLDFEQKKVLEEYYQDITINGLSPKTCLSKLGNLTLFAKAIKKPFKKITKEDIRSYLVKRSEELKPGSLTMTKSNLKNFFKWFYKTDGYPEVVNWIKTGYASHNKSLPTKIPSPDEIKMIIKKSDKVQHKAIIAVLYDTATRVGELIGMNLNDIVFDKNGAQIIVNGKTGQRIVRIIHSLPYLTSWLDIHPYREKLKDSNSSEKYPLWISESNTTWGKRLTICGIYGIVRYTAEDAIGKKIHPHLLRHARITDWARKGINEPTLRILAGWTGNSSMPDVYVHLSGRDATDQLLQIEKKGYVKPELVDNPLRIIGCPRCKSENGPTVNFCGTCGMPIDEASFITKETNLITNPLSLLSKMKEYTESYETLVKSIWDILSLKKIMERYNQLTKDQLKLMLNIDNFDNIYNDWLSTGLIKSSGKTVTFPQESKDLVNRYVDFWGGKSESS